MEEITTRFEIIRLAINLGDFRTIDLQCEKLRALSLDDKLNEIIDLLESRNYRQALYEMKHYAGSLEDDFFNASEPRSHSRKKEDSGLFAMEEDGNSEEEEHILNLDDILKLSEHRDRREVREYQATENPVSQVSVAEDGGEFPSGKELRESGEIRPDEQLDVMAEEKEEHSSDSEERAVESEEKGVVPSDGKPSETEPENQTELSRQEKDLLALDREKEFVPGAGRQADPSRYPPISYISQKYRNMIHQFPPVELESAIPEEVERMQKKISTEGYTDEEIEHFLRRYREYKEEGRKGEAALVLLLAAATESKFAQFLLARELFRGEIIREDHAEAFTQINTLADQNFAEAICDLGQFYEHGVGIGRDRQMALLLYEEAAEMGVARARKHYERLKNSKGLLGVFRKVALPKVTIPLPKKRG